MHRRIFQIAILFLWLALPLVALQYTQVWDQLPAHVATHFNAAGQANGWMSPEPPSQRKSSTRSTPTIDAGMVYTLGATGHLKCLDGKTGRCRWEKDLLEEFHITAEDWDGHKLDFTTPLMFIDRSVCYKPGQMAAANVAAYRLALDKRKAKP